MDVIDIHYGMSLIRELDRLCLISKKEYNRIQSSLEAKMLNSRIKTTIEEVKECLKS